MILNIEPHTKKGYQFFQDATLALCDIEQNGFAIDMKYCTRAKKELQTEIEAKEITFIEDTELGQVWKNHYKSKTNIYSNQQLAEVLVNDFHYELPKTKKGNIQSNKAALEDVDHIDIAELVYLKKLGTTRNTFLENIMIETVDGFCHPSFGLHTAKTYRSSCYNPNLQNMPIRDKFQGKIIRSCFIPRAKNRQIVEIDYKGIEVYIAYCYHEDPVMYEYLMDSTKDMHRDNAMDCFLLEEKQVTKEIRYVGKSSWTFPQFYGSYYKMCCEPMWKACAVLKLESGQTVRDHLLHKGIKTKLQFEKHLKKVEYKLWHRRFNVYTEWKEKWWNKYLKKGYFDTLTGFRCTADMSKNQTINYPVQGSAFHCNLWALTELNRQLKKYKFKSCLTGQIHDSQLGDVLDSELNDFIALATEIGTIKVREHWDWISVPLTVEVEVAPVGKSWFEKTEYVA